MITLRHGRVRAASARVRGHMTDDQDLIRRTCQGDEGAFEELYRRHHGYVVALARRLLGSSPDVDDVVQEVFVQLHRSLHKYRGDSKFTTWLFRVVTNVVRMHLRKQKSRPRLVQEKENPKDSRSPSSHTDGDRMVQGKRRLKAFRALLEGLSEKKRTVIMLHDLQGLTPEDVAETLQIPVATVRTRLFYGRRDLYEAMARHPELQDLCGEGSA